MKAIAHNALRAHAVIAVLSIAILASLAAIAVAAPKKQTIAVARNIDGIVIRGTWRAQVGIGTPAVTIVADEAVLRTLRIGRNARSLTIAQSIRPKGNNKAEIRVTLARLRGIATS
ncbi:MAG: hypothetical protein IAI50_00380, partial [Candidatus Eremiobacteraeota bacterium]|nr:hypothetical protein [Candidatus Eremiobacteraeota bacterium]